MAAYECKCGVSGEENFYKSSKYYCKQCWNALTYAKQKEKVEGLKKEYGGCCSRCGYDKTLNALEFHHPDPGVKEFHLAQKKGMNREKLKQELDKCVLVCRNCHVELHDEMKGL